MTSSPRLPGPRDRMVDSARLLIQERGVTGVGLREVVAHAQAPRGSLQHYFPGGKTQLVGEAVARAGESTRAVVAAAVADGTDAATTFSAVVERWRAVLSDGSFARGCPLAATVVDAATGSEELREAAETALAGWRADTAALLRRDGFPAKRAASLASLLQAAVQGALIQARAQRSTAPLDAVERELLPLLTPPGGPLSG
ncbi:TetR family transcriptional regulator [Kineococcus sp. R8]|uniref:TetR/AcrR family transcriptional regulator n=1 Tax=Kineococcus siccus TaxID=2696567 RepID=UPI0014124485|nr:TetR/AcrR family transcriptional regulator [Kineococcus siccus]NAZ83566.1 TetR family transcriptional regulator [Kineococcus siccus]